MEAGQVQLKQSSTTSIESTRYAGAVYNVAWGSKVISITEWHSRRDLPLFVTTLAAEPALASGLMFSKAEREMKHFLSNDWGTGKGLEKVSSLLSSKL